MKQLYTDAGRLSAHINEAKYLGKLGKLESQELHEQLDNIVRTINEAYED